MEPSSAPLPWEEQRWKRVLKLEGEPVLTLSLCRPAFPEEGKSARLERCLAKLVQVLEARWENELYPRACAALAAAREQSRPFDPWSAELNYKITLWRPPLLSLRLDVAERTGAGRPVLVRWGETWNLETGWPCPLHGFFPEKRRWKTQLIHRLQAEAGARLASGESLLDPDCGPVIARAFDPERFYLTEEGITVFYPLDLLGPYAEGIPAFSLPYPEPQET